jgi:integrase/recombinase XerC
MHLHETGIIQAFLDHLKFQKRYSQHTLISYENDLRTFSDFVAVQFSEPDLLKISPTIVRSWLAGLKEKGISSRSINRKISSLKSFYKYQLKEGSLKTSPMTQVISPKVSKRLPQYVEKDDMAVLFKHVEFDPGFAGSTQRLMLMLLYYTGIRQAELIGLKEVNVDFYNKNIKVLGKGSKERIIPVSESLLAEIKTYLGEKIMLEHEVDRTVLLVNERGKRLYPKYVYLQVKRYLAMITTISKKSPHILRHSFATHLTGNGADINAVKELLGHSSLAATQVYTHNNIQKLKDIHKKAHPRA